MVRCPLVADKCLQPRLLRAGLQRRYSGFCPPSTGGEAADARTTWGVRSARFVARAAPSGRVTSREAM